MPAPRGRRDEAPSRPLPQTTLYSVEYPGFLVSPNALSTAIDTLGGLDTVTAAFRRNAGTRPMELSFHPDDRLSHPLLGETLDYRSVVLKIVKRRRRRKAPSGPEVTDADATSMAKGGVYTAEAFGICRKVARFRGMADFSFEVAQPNPILDLRKAMDALDAKFITNFRISPPSEDYVLPSDPSSSSAWPVSNLGLITPPLFSNTSVPGRYEYKQNVASLPTTYTDEVTGEEKSRYTNKFRAKSYQGATITFDDPDKSHTVTRALVPTEAPTINARLGPQELTVLDSIRKLLDERPVWNRLALMNRLTVAEAHSLANNRPIYSLSGYFMSDGPWRDFLIRWGYDPRTDRMARLYQRLQFRNAHNEHTRTHVLRLEETGENDGQREESAGPNTERRSHIFDGKALHRSIGTFQFCDVEDPLLRSLIYDEQNVGKECTLSDGWYDSVAIERIKAIARRKFAGLLEGRVVTDKECTDLLTEAEPRVAIQMELRKAAEERKAYGYRRKGRLMRIKGHNMAIPPSAPEEVAAERLRRALQREQDDQISASSDDES